MTQFTYPGYFSKEAEEFFGDKVITEQRDGLAVVGHFVKLENGKTSLPSKNDRFEKDSDGNIKQLN